MNSSTPYTFPTYVDTLGFFGTVGSAPVNEDPHGCLRCGIDHGVFQARESRGRVRGMIECVCTLEAWIWILEFGVSDLDESGVVVAWKASCLHVILYHDIWYRFITYLVTR